MRLVVFSDSHGDFDVLNKIVQAHPNAQRYIHLGDGERDLSRLAELYPDLQMQSVKGNCDWASADKLVDCFTTEGKRVMITHGHVYNVKFGLESLHRHAVGLRADLVLFGHTHIAYKSYEDGIYYFNPGSVSSPNRDKPSYGLVDITKAGIALNIAYL